MDFTLNQYTQLVKSLINVEYSFQTFREFIENPLSKVAILRHDVDRLPQNSLNMASLEFSLKVKGTYYFRTIPGTFNEEIIFQVATFGHEIGYHYETMDSVSRKTNAKNGRIKDKSSDIMIDSAYQLFCQELDRLRNIYPVKTICMHGSPLSKFDNRDIWKKYDYHCLGIIGEPYFDVDYNKVFYMTDTGRKWNNKSSNVRDIVNRAINIPIKSTDHLISIIKHGELPDKIMINTHPHRWFEGGFGWYKEYVGQNLKNVGKGILLSIRDVSK